MTLDIYAPQSPRVFSIYENGLDETTPIYSTFDWIPNVNPPNLGRKLRVTRHDFLDGTNIITVQKNPIKFDARIPGTFELSWNEAIDLELLAVLENLYNTGGAFQFELDALHRNCKLYPVTDPQYVGINPGTVYDIYNKINNPSGSDTYDLHGDEDNEVEVAGAVDAYYTICIDWDTDAPRIGAWIDGTPLPTNYISLGRVWLDTPSGLVTVLSENTTGYLNRYSGVIREFTPKYSAGIAGLIISVEEVFPYAKYTR